MTILFAVSGVALAALAVLVACVAGPRVWLFRFRSGRLSARARVSGIVLATAIWISAILIAYYSLVASANRDQNRPQSPASSHR
jgi:hypothetical protein